MNGVFNRGGDDEGDDEDEDDDDDQGNGGRATVEVLMNHELDGTGPDSPTGSGARISREP